MTIDLAEDTPLDLQQLIYTSTATSPLSDQDLLDLLNHARLANMDLNITGMLVYSEGTFIQVIEGSSESLTYLYSKIEKDSRHRNCILVLRQNVARRAFAGWFMGFYSPCQSTVENTLGFIDCFSDSPSPHRAAAARLINSFDPNSFQ